MKKKERLTFIVALLLLTFAVVIGKPANIGDDHYYAVLADSDPAVTSGAAISVTSGAAVTSSPTPTTEPTGTPTPTAEPTATPIPTPTATPTPTPTPKPTSTPTPTPTGEPIVYSIGCYYKGGAIEVGEKINPDDIVVNAHMSNGSVEAVPADEYTISDMVVSKVGSNRIVIIYKGYSDYFYVFGIELKSISIETERSFFGQYNGIDERDLTVTATYSDGSTKIITKGYTIEPFRFEKTGTQYVTVKYKTCEASLPVFVNATKPVKTLSVSYSGGDLVQDHEIDRADLTVVAVYNDSTLSTERITTYSMQEKSFAATGEQTLTVEYMGVTGTCKINVIAKKIVGMKAEYTGGEVEVGYEFVSSEMHVYLIYNDESEKEIDDYMIYDPIIRYLGENVLRIYHGDFNTTCKIKGIEVAPPDFTYTSDFSIKSGKRKFTISAAIPKRLGQDCIEGTLVKKTKLTKAFRKLKSKTAWYCAFNIAFSDEDYDVFYPLTVRISVPYDIEPEYTDLYYTPNRKSILGRMAKEITKDGEIEVMIFREGTYLIVYDPEAYAEPEVEEESADEE